MSSPKNDQVIINKHVLIPIGLAYAIIVVLVSMTFSVAWFGASAVKDLTQLKDSETKTNEVTGQLVKALYCHLLDAKKDCTQFITNLSLNQ